MQITSGQARGFKWFIILITILSTGVFFLVRNATDIYSVNASPMLVNLVLVYVGVFFGWQFIKNNLSKIPVTIIPDKPRQVCLPGLIIIIVVKVDLALYFP